MRPIAAVGLLLGCVIVACGLAWAEWLIHNDWPFWAGDFDVYRLGATAIRDDAPLYTVKTPDHGWPFVYTPMAAALFVPFTFGSAGAAAMVWIALEATCLVLVVWLTLNVVGLSRPAWRVAATVFVSAASLIVAPIDVDLTLGQINILLMLLVLADLTAGNVRRWQGVGVGVAAAVKLVPLLFIVYLVATRRLQAAVVASGVFLLAVLGGFILLPGDSMTYWSGAAFDLSRFADPRNPVNQSLYGVIVRLFDASTAATAIWLAAAVVVTVVGVAMSALLYRSGYVTRSVLVCGLTAVLVSPISWRHHWVWIVPTLIVIGALAWQRRSAWWTLLFVAVCVIFGLNWFDWYVPFGALDLSLGQQVIAMRYPLAGVALITALVADTRRRTPVSLPGWLR
ncbi:MAG TPA: glycosyltransferase 87 family protein [Pseudonocardiaceae bacterium]|nr:glycosyltransferase 87 family protein [Pseudonocardiaceae bacterium]